MNRKQKRKFTRRSRGFPGIEYTVNGEQRMFVANRDAIPHGPCWIERYPGGGVRIVPITEDELTRSVDLQRRVARLRARCS